MPLTSKAIMLGLAAASLVGNHQVLRVHCLAIRPALHKPLINALPSAALGQALTARYMTNTSSDNDSIKLGISRLATLQTMLSKAGAPGSKFCNKENDLQPVLSGEMNVRKLHPHLFPIAQSKSNPSHYICGLRRAFADDAEYESSTNAPWPIVESSLDGPGYDLLALNTEHMMRRIAAQADFDGNDDTESDLVQIYNSELGQGALSTPFDQPYTRGDVAKLGYGLSKYVLLRVGPFPDLYSEMTTAHLSRDDESSALIAAETANGKFPGFGSTFASYARVLAGLKGRDEEARDAARMTLRLPLPSAGLMEGDFAEIACVAQLCEDSEDISGGMEGLKGMYDKIKEHEKEDNTAKSGMSKEQVAIEEANFLLDSMVFETEGRDWESIRGELAKVYADAGMLDMAEFVDSGFA